VISREVAKLFRRLSESFNHSLDTNTARLCDLGQRELIRVVNHLIATNAAIVQMFDEEGAEFCFASRLDQRA